MDSFFSKFHSIRNTKQISPILFILFSLTSFSQDLIIKKDGNKIYCRILQEDSVSLHYLSNKGDFPSTAVINKTEVKKYFYASPVPPVLPANPEIELDSAYSEKKLLLHFNTFFGANIPSGDFGSKNPKNKKAGFADKGIIAGLSVTLKLSKYIGLTGLYFYQKNRYDHDVISAFLNLSSDKQFYTEASAWKVKGLLGGFYLTFPIKTFPNLYFECNALAGIPTYTSPEFIKNTIHPNGDIQNIKQLETDKSSLTYFFNAGLRYKIVKNIYINAGLDFMKSKTEFTSVLIEYTYTYGVDSLELLHLYGQ